ncbi:MAG: NAD(P)-dependent alcohol dehydrogenase, partial [Oleiphilaceae bacterium]|nr:NAD(P)-dependent alcohol dehydrogenase [Oleiphilaceae bacterium]
RVGLGWHAGYCHQCKQCHTGHHNLCGAAQGTIINHHGGFAERVRAQASSVVALPQGLDAAQAGPLFCGGITVFTPFLDYDISPSARVGIIGIGGLGHLALQFANAWGCEVWALSSSANKREEATRLGAHAVLDSRNEQALKAAQGSFDLLISTVNVELDWNLYLSLLAPRGRLHFVGATLAPLNLQAFGLIAAQRSVSGSPVGSPAAIATMLDFAERHNIAPQVEHFAMSQVNEALDHLREGKAHYRIVLDNDWH